MESTCDDSRHCEDLESFVEVKCESRIPISCAGFRFSIAVELQRAVVIVFSAIHLYPRLLKRAPNSVQCFLLPAAIHNCFYLFGEFCRFTEGIRTV